MEGQAIATWHIRFFRIFSCFQQNTPCQFSTPLNTLPTASSFYCHETCKAKFGFAQNDCMMANPEKTKIQHS